MDHADGRHQSLRELMEFEGATLEVIPEKQNEPL